jgi:hypothetical protein
MKNGPAFLPQQPAQAQQQQATHKDTRKHPEAPCLFNLVIGQPVKNQTYKNNIIDTQYNFEHNQDYKADNAFAGKKMFHAGGVVLGKYTEEEK